mgnify:CR=1 FL=1
MGTKRIGLARLEALLENLKREINLSGSTMCAQLGACQGNFGAPPLVIDDDSTVAAGTDEAIMVHQYADGLRLHVQNIGTQTVLIPAAATTGMDYGYDGTNNEGVQWVASLNTHKGYPGVDRFTVGTHGAFYAELEFSIEDVSGTDDCAFGFRKVEAEQANLDDYDEMAVLNAVSGNIYIQNILNDGDTLDHDTLKDWADGEVHTLRVDVSSAGVVTYKIDGSAPTLSSTDSADGADTFTFDDGEVVTPFFYYINAAHVAGEVILRKVKWGLVEK